MILLITIDKIPDNNYLFAKFTPSKIMMNRVRYIFTLLFVCCLYNISIAVETDTLTAAILSHYENIRSLYDLNEVSVKNRKLSIDEARTVSEHQLELAQNSDNKKALGDALDNMGLFYLRFNKPGKSLEYLTNSYMTRKGLNDQKGMGVAFANIGYAYYKMGNDDKALEYLKASSKILNSERFDAGMAVVNDFMGQVYFDMKDYQNAENYFNQSQNIYHLLNKSQQEERLKTIANLVAMKLNSGGITESPSVENNKDTLRKNPRNSGASDVKHKVTELLNDSKGIDQLGSIKIQNLSEEEIKAKIKRDSLELEELKRDHALNDMNLTHEEDSIKDAQRDQQMEVLQGKISSANQALLQKQLQLSKVAQQKVWFLGGAAIIFLLTLFFYNRYRLKKKAFVQLEHAHDELKATRDKLLEAEQFKDQFLANMSHEIRTPMNAIIGASNLVLNTKLDEVQMKYMRAVKQSSANLLVIINDILDLSKIKSGKLEFEYIPFHTKEVIEGVITTLHFKAEEKGLTLTSTFAAYVPLTIVGDQVRLSQVLLNLVSNAIKFTSKGGVSIDCKLKGMKDNKAEIEFSVTDSGIGIPEDKFDKIFESFSQVGVETTRLYGGTGLGLTISRQLVSLQGGTINVKSKLGEGTTFTATIPYEVYSGLGMEEEQHQSRELGGDKVKNIRILIAEDNEMNQMVVVDTLEGLIEGVQIDIAENGKIAVDKLQQKEYDLILMDVQMPVMNGYEASQYIREQLPPPLNKMKIMAMTASATKPEVDKCFSSGMDDYISKPFDPDDLLKKIIALINK